MASGLASTQAVKKSSETALFGHDDFMYEKNPNYDENDSRTASLFRQRFLIYKKLKLELHATVEEGY